MTKLVKLTSKEYYKLVRELRRDLDTHTKERIAPLVLHCNYLRERCNSLENELRKALQPELFENKDRHEKLLRAQFKRRYEKIKKYPLPQRLKLLVEKDMVNSKQWLRELKWGKLTHLEAIELVKKIS